MDNTQFKLSGERTEIPQQHYNTLTDITTKTYKKFKNCIAIIAHNCIKIDNTDEQENKTTIENIKEQQQKLNSYTQTLTLSINATTQTLDREYKNQIQQNREAAHTIIQELEKEKQTIQQDNKTWNDITEIIITPLKQETTNKIKQNNKPTTPLCTICKSDRPKRHNAINCNATRCTNTWCNKLFHSAHQCRTPKNRNEKQQTTNNSNKETNNKPLCTRCKSDRPTKHIRQQCTAALCTNTWCKKPFHSAIQCKTKKPLCERCHSDRPTRHISAHCKAEICTNTWCNKLFHNAYKCRTPRKTQEQQNNTQNNDRNTPQQKQQQCPPTNNKGTLITATQATTAPPGT